MTSFMDFMSINAANNSAPNHLVIACLFSFQIVLYRQEAVLAADCDMPSVHCVLSKLPDNLPIEHLCSYAGDLFVQYPPAELEQEAMMQYEL